MSEFMFEKLIRIFFIRGCWKGKKLRNAFYYPPSGVLFLQAAAGLYAQARDNIYIKKASNVVYSFIRVWQTRVSRNDRRVKKDSQNKRS